MMDTNTSATDNITVKTTGRKSLPRQHRQLYVSVLPAEEQMIKQLAAATGLSVSAYLRKLGVGTPVHGMLDHRQVEELARVNGDLGHLARLLALWLANDPRTASFGKDTMRAVLSRIDDTQRAMQEVMRGVVLPGGH